MKTLVFSTSVAITEIGNSIYVTGNTYPLRDQLRELGGRYDKNTKYGPAYILHVSRKAEVMKLREGKKHL